MEKHLFGFALLCVLSLVHGQTEERVYRMCVPHMYYEDCQTLLKDPSEAGIQMECVAGRDRMECLSMINQRKADVLASEPEDMYVAYHTKNQDFRVISEIRTKADKDAEFRYEGIILVKKNSNIHNLADLRGKKSCHTGFGRNVGFKIPVTKLKNANILKVSMDPDVSATERELKALSEFFSKSCLVGNYSHSPESDRLLKKKYENLCALCEKPAQCNYPDKYSGYDGAIRCLDKGAGDVAFTKVQFIKKYFGLMPGSTAEGDASNFEYLCEDGTRRPLTGPACSWAQRPWMGYLSNTDTVKTADNLHQLQSRLEKFFENGLHAQNKESAAHLLIHENAVYHSKPEAVEPKVYLERSGYKDVIERDGSMTRKFKFCVKTPLEVSKCDALRLAAYSRDIRPELECVQADDCFDAVKTSKADFTSVRGSMYKEARAYHLMPVMYEHYGENNYYVVVVDPALKKNAIQAMTPYFDESNERARIAAAFLNKQRSLSGCQSAPASEKKLQIVNSKDLEKYKDMQLLCPNMDRKPITEWRTCNFEANLPNAIFVSESMTTIEQESMKDLFSALTAKFGAGSKTADVFALFGDFHKDADNVLFNDEAVGFLPDLQNDITMESIYDELKCKTNTIAKN